MKKKIGENILKIILTWLFVSMLFISLFYAIKGATIAEGDYTWKLTNLKNVGSRQKVWGIDIEKSGNYNVKVDLKTDSTGVVTAYRLYSENETLVDYGIGVNLQEEAHEVSLDAGHYKLKVLFLSDEKELEDLLKEVNASKDLLYDELAETDGIVNAKIDYAISHCVETNFWMRFLNWGIVIGSLLGIALIPILCLGKNKEIVTGAKKSYAGIGMALAFFSIMSLALSYTSYEILDIFLDGEEFLAVAESVGFLILQYVLSYYVLAFGGAFLLLQKVEKEKMIQHKMTVMQFLCCVCMSMTVYIVSTKLTILFQEYILFPLGWKGEVNSNPDSILWRILIAMIGAPIFEELLCRKFIIDRVRKYGEGMAILVSGLMFGIMHGTVSQTFMAAACGVFWAYIYVRTGKIKYTIILHMLENTLNTIIGVLAKEFPDFAYYLKVEKFMYLVAMAGFVMWIVNYKKMYLVKAPEQITEKKIRTVFGNFGLIITILVSAYLLIL